MDEDLPDAIPAATLILMRAAAAGPPEILMLERADRSRRPLHRLTLSWAS
jgi:hypothetical protein